MVAESRWLRSLGGCGVSVLRPNTAGERNLGKHRQHSRANARRARKAKRYDSRSIPGKQPCSGVFCSKVFDASASSRHDEIVLPPPGVANLNQIGLYTAKICNSPPSGRECPCVSRPVLRPRVPVEPVSGFPEPYFVQRRGQNSRFLIDVAHPFKSNRCKIWCQIHIWGT